MGKNRVELIAELSWCHMGDMLLAAEMIHAAAEAGADYAKFQTWQVKHLKPGPWDKDGRRQIYEKAELSEDDHYHLREICSNHNVEFLTSCFTMKNIDFVRSITNKVKLPGVECRNQELVQAALDKFDEVFLSTGTTSLSEIPEVNHKDNLVLMHCVSSYPCKPELVNIKRMLRMQEIFDVPVGYSGHYPGIWDAVCAIQHGAVVVEKHFTTDNNLPGRDNKFALLPDEFKKIKEFATEGALMHGDLIEDYLEIEQDGRDFYTGRWDG
jgi:sialic acid synthase SpsE